MFQDLPEELKTQVLRYLEADQFCLAKQLIDKYKAKLKNSMPVLVH